MLNYLKLLKNWWAVLTLSSSHVVLTLEKSNIPQACLDKLCKMLIGHTTFPSFLCPIFWQCHWSPYHVDIYISQIHGSQFRKRVILHGLILSKSPVLMHYFSISLYQCILFYFIQLIIAQFSIYVKFLWVYNCVLLGLVVALETVIDAMIDICIPRVLTNHTCTLHIWLNDYYHLFTMISFCIHVKLWHIFKSIWSHTPCMLSHYYFSFYLIMPLYCIICINLYDHMPCEDYCMYVCMYVCYIVVLWTILSLMLTTSHPKAIGGVC